MIFEGREALKVGDAERARRAFERALACAATGDAIEGLARSEYLDGDFNGSIQRWEEAYAAYRREGDHAGAVRCARNLGYMHGAVMGVGR